MRKILSITGLAASLFASAQVNLSEGFENTTYPGFTNVSFFRSNVISACVGTYVLNRNFWSGGTSGSTTFSSTASNGGKLNISFQYKTHIYSNGSVNGSMKVEYSNDGGQTYKTLETVSLTSVFSCRTWSGSIPQGSVPANADFKLRVSGQWTSGDYWLVLDDFKVSQDAFLAISESDNKTSKVYPNPFTDVIILQDADLINALSVSDMLGRTVKNINVISKEVNLKNLDKGIYILNMRYKDGRNFSQKVIKK